jgi:hypothetical protein
VLTSTGILQSLQKILQKLVGFFFNHEQDFRFRFVTDIGIGIGIGNV